VESGNRGPWVTIAQVVAPRGNRGEVSAAPLSDHPERFRLLKQVFLFGPDGPLGGGAPAEIESLWNHRGRLVLKFRGVDSIGAAELLRGAEVRIPASQRFELEAGEYYLCDLMGCEVIERPSGLRLGRVAGWQDYGGPMLLDVKPDAGGEGVLVPFARAICVEIDIEAKRIVVDLPDGLKELNRP